MPYLETFLSLHNQDRGLKANRSMVQRKGNLSVKDGRNSERAQEDPDIIAAVSMVGVPTAPPALGDLPPYLAEGTGESEPELVLPSQICQGTKFGGGRAPTGAGQYPF